MFRDLIQLRLDAKGTLAIPAKYRSELIFFCCVRLIITADPSRCLLIYPQPAW